MPNSLTSPYEPKQAAERRGDDILAWLARLNVAQLIIHGANGQTFLENEFLQVR